MIYCDLFPQPSASNDVVILNLDARIIEQFSYADNAPREVLFYVYGIMNSHAYLDTFEGVLYSGANPDSPPRIPIFTEEHSRQAISELGQRIAECESSNFHVEFTEQDEISVNWPEGVEEILLANFEYDGTHILTLKDENNQEIILSNIAPEIMALRISGHDVVNKWLRERKYAYLRRSLRNEDIQALTNLLQRINAQLILLRELDSILSPILDGNIILADALVPPPLS
jgi:hypothetical protein